MKKDSGIVIKRASLCSLDFAIRSIIPSGEKKLKEAAPKDKFFFLHILFVLMGLMHFIPYTFFITANATVEKKILATGTSLFQYWMYKFRNTTADITDTDARTFLQIHFSPANTIITTAIPPVVTVVSTFLGHKIKARVRVLVILSAMSLCFILGTAFVKINTDSWQLLFFFITMAILLVINCANAALSAANFTILSKFPHYYMKVYLTGQGFGGILSSTLQTLSIALGTSTEVSALFYFISGTTLMILTVVLFYSSKYNQLYAHYINSSEEDIHRDMLPLSEVKVLAKQIWSPIVAFAILLLTMSIASVSITSLVVSENYGSGSVWTDKYFVPVITFLYSDMLSLIGRLMSSNMKKALSGVPLCIFMLGRMLIIIPLVFLCNAQPRHHLPLIFSHDWEYILIVGVNAFSNGYIMNMTYLDIVKLVKPEKIEDAYLVMALSASIAAVLCTPVGVLAVDIL